MASSFLLEDKGLLAFPTAFRRKTIWFLVQCGYTKLRVPLFFETSQIGTLLLQGVYSEYLYLLVIGTERVRPVVRQGRPVALHPLKSLLA